MCGHTSGYMEGEWRSPTVFLCDVLGREKGEGEGRRVTVALLLCSGPVVLVVGGALWLILLEHLERNGGWRSDDLC